MIWAVSQEKFSWPRLFAGISKSTGRKATSSFAAGWWMPLAASPTTMRRFGSSGYCEDWPRSCRRPSVLPNALVKPRQFQHQLLELRVIILLGDLALGPA